MKQSEATIIVERGGFVRHSTWPPGMFLGLSAGSGGEFLIIGKGDPVRCMWWHLDGWEEVKKPKSAGERLYDAFNTEWPPEDEPWTRLPANLKSAYERCAAAFLASEKEGV